LSDSRSAAGRLGIAFGCLIFDDITDLLFDYVDLVGELAAGLSSIMSPALATPPFALSTLPLSMSLILSSSPMGHSFTCLRGQRYWQAFIL